MLTPNQSAADFFDLEPDSLTLVRQTYRGSCAFLEWRGEIGCRYIVLTYLDFKLYLGISDREMRADHDGIEVASGTFPAYSLNDFLAVLKWKAPKQLIEFEF